MVYPAMEAQANEEYNRAFRLWLKRHIQASKGARKNILSQGLHPSSIEFAGRVWWPAFRTFEMLHPEFEVVDFKDGYRYLDFAYLIHRLRICIEIDGRGTHWRDIDQSKFSDHLVRQNHLMIDGWLVLRFSYHDIKHNPRRCQQILQQAFGKWGIMKVSSATDITDPIDRAILERLRHNARPMSPSELAAELGWHRVTMSRHMRNLAKSGQLIPSRPNAKSIRQYTYNFRK